MLALLLIATGCACVAVYLHARAIRHLQDAMAHLEARLRRLEDAPRPPTS